LLNPDELKRTYHSAHHVHPTQLPPTNQPEIKVHYLFAHKSSLFEPLRTANPCVSCCCGYQRLKPFDSHGPQPTLWLDFIYFLKETSENIPFNYVEVFLFIQNIFLCMLCPLK
jgi:hypothetical protein